jgi:class 3 adenylate cyclase
MTNFSIPTTRYALSGDINIAYQVLGDRPIDVVLVPGLISNIEVFHELPGYTAFLRRLAGFARVITFDKRGQGLSDRVTDVPSLEQRMDDVRSVMEATGSRRANLLGFSEGAPMSALFAATYPDCVSSLILFGGFAKDGYQAASVEERAANAQKHWGTGLFINRAESAHRTVSAETIALYGKVERACASPGAIRAMMLMNSRIDVLPTLKAVRVPTLVLHRRGDMIVPAEQGRALASMIPGAKYIEYPEGDHVMWSGDAEALVGDIEEFTTGERHSGDGDSDRILATILFTDIVGSTQTAVELGDDRWRRLLEEHDRLGQQIVERYRGRVIKKTGDGIVATFDGPGRAVRGALAFSSAARDIGVQVRAGLHTGEIETCGQDIGGVGVHAAARVMGQSQPGEVLVSRVVTDLVAGANLRFAERGSHELKGLPGRWDLFAASL